MKPHPSYVLAALELAQTEARDAVLIGDSVTDVEVSHATDLRVIGYAKTPQRGLELAAAGADAATDSMSSLVETRSAGPR
jgi:phosphoglycolate phosphatase